MMLHLIRKINIFLIFYFLFSCDNTEKKNVIIILADDLGYTDLSCFGSEINTPNIDNLASEGVIFTNYHSSPLCAPSRAMLLSGNDNHVAGIGIQAFSSQDYGYEGILSDRVAIIPEILKNNGYKTFMSGKWHIGGDPISRGFDDTFALLPGAFTHYDNNKPIKGYPDSAFSLNGKKILWEEGKYSSDEYTDRFINYIDKSDDSPFFGYLSLTAPHWPLQVDRKFSDKYKGFYDNGFEDIKISRLNKIKAKQLINIKEEHFKVKDFISEWQNLTDEGRKIESRKMEIYAGMIDNLDFNVGRVVKFLKEKNKFKNTIIIFMSDNGAAAEDFYYNQTYGPYIQDKFSYEYNDIGKPESFVSLGKNWADVITNPFNLYKGFTTSGGMRSPLIISGLSSEKKISKEFVTLLDIAPTIYNLTNSKYELLNKNRIKKPIGESIIPYLSGEDIEIHDEDYVFSFEHSGNAVLIKNNWKIVNKTFPFNINNFDLYNLDDISELNNLKGKEVIIYNDLLTEWNKYILSKNIIFPTPYRDDLN
ncbi:MAG: sulfatase [Cytophagia bacterium]|nr:sulfatase [Cytophagia bacterium]